jgi:hypothetical protein
VRRTLVLSRETLTELTPEDLASVAGAAATAGCPTKPPTACLSLPLACGGAAR